MELNISRDSKSPIYMQIKNVIKQKIVDGEWISGFRLPSERVLAREAGVHRNTVIHAYDELIREGLIASSATSKAYVVTYEASGVKRQKVHASSLEFMIKDEFFHMNTLFHRLLKDSEKKPPISFAIMNAPEDLLPTEEVSELLHRLIEENPQKLFGYCDVKGLPELCENISAMVARRGIKAMPSQIQIVAEVNQALEYISKMYLRPGDAIVTEEPVMPSFFHFFHMIGVKVLTVPMDEEGIDMAHLEYVIKQYNPKFLYTLPTFHNPTTITMSLDRRYEVLNCCERYGIPIIEEDCVSEFRYEGIRLPSLYAISGGQNVIYLDVLLHTFIPAARVGYLIASKGIIDKIGNLIRQDHLFVNTISQYLASEYLKSGAYERQVLRLIEAYRSRRDSLCGKLKELPEGLLQFGVPEGGIHLWGRLSRDISQKKLFNEAAKLGIAYLPGFFFFPYGNKGDSYMRLAYSCVTETEIEQGVRLLGQALERSGGL